MAKTTSDLINERHRVSWTGVWDILKERGTLKKWPALLCVILSTGASLGALCLGECRSFIVLQSITDLTITVFPNLLGFSLGGYALVVGFGNTELIEKSTKTTAFSIYQNLSAIFAITVLAQVFTVLIAFAVSWIIKINFNSLFSIGLNMAGNIANAIGVFFILFGALYSLVMTPYVVVNLFTLSQVNNMHYTIQKIIKDKAKSTHEKGDSA